MSWPWIAVLVFAALSLGACFGAILMGAVSTAARQHRHAELDHTFLSRSAR